MITNYVDMIEFLKKHNITHEEMDAIWKKLKDSNRIVKNLAENGKQWFDLPEHLLVDAIKRGRS